MDTKIEKIVFDLNNVEIFDSKVDNLLLKNEDNFLNKITWLKINGLDVTDDIRNICQDLKIGDLVFEDIIHTNQTPRIEVFDDFVYFVLRRVYFDENSNDYETEQITILLKNNIVVSFEEKDSSLFNKIKKIVQANNLQVRSQNSDFLAYLLIDVVVDEYMDILAEIFEKIEEFEELAIKAEDKSVLSKIFIQKKHLILLKKSVAPMIDHFFEIKNFKTPLIRKNVLVYFKDINDHIVKADNAIDTYRETLTALIETFSSMQSMKMNEIMKLFTIIAGIFMPLTLITGIYGMNFENMPETHWKYGYFAILIIIFAMGVGMFFLIRKRKWL